MGKLGSLNQQPNNRKGLPESKMSGCNIAAQLDDLSRTCLPYSKRGLPDTVCRETTTRLGGLPTKKSASGHVEVDAILPYPSPVHVNYPPVQTINTWVPYPTYKVGYNML